MSNRAWKRRRATTWRRDHGQWRTRNSADPADQHPRWMRTRPFSGRSTLAAAERQMKRWTATLDYLRDRPVDRSA